MVTALSSIYRVVAQVCWWAMVVATSMTGLWLLFATISWDAGPIPRADKIGWSFFTAFVISVCLFRKFPLVAVLTAWAVLAITLSGAIPGADSLKTFLRQFEYDHLFFVAANVGFWAKLMLRRTEMRRTSRDL
jgi:hypothetical protein